jgi:hypothetical protein
MAARDAKGTVLTDASGHPAPGLTLADAIYGHGLVQSLYTSGTGEGVTKWFGGGKKLPSYIPSRTFASALFDLLFPDDEPSGAPAVAPAPALPASGVVPPGPAPTSCAGRRDLQSMLGMLKSLPPSKGKEAIITLVRQAEGDIARTRQAFESWYDDGMDRAAGWYKRKTQLVLFCLGMSVAVILNVDSIAVARALWTSPALRSYAVTAAEQYAKGSEGKPPKPDASAQLSRLQKLSLPIGWDEPKYPWIDQSLNAGGYTATEAMPAWHSSRGGLLFALVGWLLTALAMTMGAPFWFDTLNQFMVVRSTIKSREKSEVEASKDPRRK